MALAQWLTDQCERLFQHWDLLNGTVLKPAGTSNFRRVAFPDDHKIVKVRSRVSIERGDFNQGKGQMHSHTLVEVAHRYLDQTDGATGIGEDTGKPHVGVHTNVMALRDYLNRHIPEMQIDPDRRPQKIYVNSKLLTKGTDQSNKWLTLQYITKQSAKDGHGGTINLRQQEERAYNPELSRVKANMLKQTVTAHEVKPTSLSFEGMGGALEEGTPFARPVPKRGPKSFK